MNGLRIATCLGILLTIALPASADLEYQFVDYPDLQNGHTLSGLLTLSDSAADNGFLTNEEILDWNFAVTGPRTYGSSKVADSFVISGEVLIDTESIKIVFPEEDDTNAFDLTDNSGGPTLRYQLVNDIDGVGIIDLYGSTENGSNDEAWQFFGGTLGGSVTEGWVIATAVPEPSSHLLLLGGCLLTALRGRRRR